MILVVDDHADTCRLTQRLLRRTGLDSKVASDGETALDMMAQERPEAVLLDNMMPGLSGIEVFRTMRADPQLADVPVVFYSADPNPAPQGEALELGASWVIKGGAEWSDVLKALVDAMKSFTDLHPARATCRSDA